jgi:GNAT superfamily N-acetyltransferase
MSHTPNAVHAGHGYADLLTASGDHPFVRHEIPPSLADVWWSADDAIAVRRVRHRGGMSVIVLGADTGIRDLVGAVPEIVRSIVHDPAREPFSVTVPQHLESLLQADLRILGGGDWEWFLTEVAPVEQPGDEAVVPLDDVGRGEEVAAFLARHSPTADTPPGGGERWFAIETGAGRLAAVAAHGHTAAGAPHLSSVAVDEALRGRGLGRRIVSVVTRLAVAEHGVCTLGMYSHNTVARGLYLSLGYVNPCRWASRSAVLRA